MKFVVGVICLACLAGCAQMRMAKPDQLVLIESAEAEGPTRPRARPTSLAPPPAATARTAEQFDTTSAADRAEAAAVPATSAERKLGSAVVSLGDPTQPGFWLETPLVSSETKGRVSYGGQSAQVDLRPSDTGSRISLAAMRLIGAPLTDLPEVEIFELGS